MAGLHIIGISEFLWLLSCLKLANCFNEKELFKAVVSLLTAAAVLAGISIPYTKCM